MQPRQAATVNSPQGDTTIAHLLGARQRFVEFVRRRVADPEAAEDIVQDALLRALRAETPVNDDEAITRWFYRVLQNAVVDHYRRSARERKHVTQGEPFEMAAEAD